MAIKRLISHTLIILTAMGLVVIVVSSFDQIACEGQPINNNVSPTQAQQIWGERIISQSFVASRDGLNRLDILFLTYQRQNTHNVTLRLLEISSTIDNPLQGVEIFKTSFNAATISDQFWRTFTVSPISDSAGKTYLIALESPDSGDGNAITVGGIERDVYAPGLAFLGPVPVRADITFRACFQMTFFEKLQVLSAQMTGNRPALWGQPAFYLLCLLIYTILCVSCFWQLAKLASR